MHSYQEMRWYTIEIKTFSVINDVLFVAELAIFAYHNFDFCTFIIYLQRHTSHNIDYKDNNTGCFDYCESIFVICYLQQFPWFLQSALIHWFLNLWFQILQATINEKIVFRWILIFCGLSEPRNELKLESHD